MNFTSRSKTLEKERNERAMTFWGSLFTELIRFSIDGSSELLKCESAVHAQSVAHAASILADAALAEFEARWADMPKGML